MKAIGSYLQKQEDVQSIVRGIEQGLSEQLVSGLSGSVRSIFTEIIYEATKRPILLVTHQLSQAEKLYEDLLELLGSDEVYLYPVNELVASELSVASPELRSARIDALMRWYHKKQGILIAPIAALKRFLPPPAYYQTYELPFVFGEEIPLETYLASLVHMGYRRVDMVTTPGEFSVRGGILDMYPVTEANPIRVELFDEEVDSIRYFDAGTQRSLEQIKHIAVGPASELLLTEEDLQAGVDRLQKAFDKTLEQQHSVEKRDELAEAFAYDLEKLRSGDRIDDIYKYASYFYDQPHSLTDYLPENGLYIIDDQVRVEEMAKHLDNEEVEWKNSLHEMNRLLDGMDFSLSWEDVEGRWQQQKVYFSTFMRYTPQTSIQNIVHIQARTMQEFHGQLNVFTSEMKRWHEHGYSVVILAPTKRRQERIKEVLAEHGISAQMSDELNLPTNVPIIVEGRLEGGSEYPQYQLAIVTDSELFQTKQRKRRRPQKISNAERIKSYQELNVGDYVVHENHGVGKYIGIETLQMNGLHKDYMVIQYLGDDRLFVPIDQVDLVQKFVGSEGKQPRLYKLGGTEWARVKKRVQSSVEDIADDLIELYAEREAQKGHAFKEDTELQVTFEAAFPYQETEDQIRCIAEIKADMEKERPMDRLLCGDVGYGKTEVAIRAAFKAVAEGKQVAVLVPTTILAQQHYDTMVERFRDHAVEIGLLSRFRTPKQQKATLEKLKKGEIDILIGTHRLLSNDVVYKDLGLLIVDEEQRFGVKHKEKVKQLKTNIDVLTLTATPIPRTLHMSMLGVRDLSVLETPPENRFPIQTYVMEHNPMLIREAVEREMARGGQVFYLHNRVQGIEKVAEEISLLIPQARVAVAHGQMNESQLENVMIGFLEGDYDVLVSTTIIETGVDIPNVNTLIVQDADHMGLSQLYQLRGRVGRSNRIAYAYFTYQKDKILTEVAEKRLQAIKEFTELGSGFKIAMRDLSIRGAGNLLGAEQHGFIDSVGFDMYSKMLKNAIDQKRQKKDVVAEVPFETELSLQLNAYIPSTYITDENQKIDIYKQFQLLENDEAEKDLQGELIDRFGDYPVEVENLFIVTRLKRSATAFRIEKITETKRDLTLLLAEEVSQGVDGAKLLELANRYGRLIQLGTDRSKLKVIFKWSKQSPCSYDLVIEFIRSLSEVIKIDESTVNHA